MKFEADYRNKDERKKAKSFDLQDEPNIMLPEFSLERRIQFSELSYALTFFAKDHKLFFYVQTNRIRGQILIMGKEALEYVNDEWVVGLLDNVQVSVVYSNDIEISFDCKFV